MDTAVEEKEVLETEQAELEEMPTQKKTPTRAAKPKKTLAKPAATTRAKPKTTPAKTKAKPATERAAPKNKPKSTAGSALTQKQSRATRRDSKPYFFQVTKPKRVKARKPAR